MMIAMHFIFSANVPDDQSLLASGMSNQGLTRRREDTKEGAAFDVEIGNSPFEFLFLLGRELDRRMHFR